MKTFQKQPQDVLDYDVDMSAWFAGIPEDDIQSVSLTVTSPMEDPPLLVVSPLPHVKVLLIGERPTAFKVWLGGGTNYCDYVVTCVVSTEQDRQKELEFKIKVRDL